MEACYAEGSKSRGDAVPQTSLRPLAHQNCIRRDRIIGAHGAREGAHLMPFLRHNGEFKSVSPTQRLHRPARLATTNQELAFCGPPSS